MAETWYYGGGQYTSEADVNAAVAAMKVRLDNNPTDWVTIKEVTNSGGGHWVVSGDQLTDAEINNLDPTKFYNVSAVHSGDTYTGVTGTQADEYVQSIRSDYAVWKDVDRITKIYEPTETDMTPYVTEE